MRLINPCGQNGAWLQSLPTMLQELFQSNQEAHWRYQGCTPRQNSGKHLQQNVCTMCLVHLGAGCFSGLPTLLKHRETLAVQPFAPEENCGNSTYPTLATAASASWPLHHKLQMTLCGKKCPTMSCSRGKMVIPRNITKLVCRDTCICGN